MALDFGFFLQFIVLKEWNSIELTKTTTTTSTKMTAEIWMRARAFLLHLFSGETKQNSVRWRNVMTNCQSAIRVRCWFTICIIQTHAHRDRSIRKGQELCVHVHCVYLRYLVFASKILTRWLLLFAIAIQMPVILESKWANERMLDLKNDSGFTPFNPIMSVI